MHNAKGAGWGKTQRTKSYVILQQPAPDKVRRNLVPFYSTRRASTTFLREALIAGIMPEMTVKSKLMATRASACKGWKCRSEPIPVTAFIMSDISGQRI